MKKLLLSMVTMLFGATMMSAAEVTFDFANETYGLTRENDNNGSYIEPGTVLTENGGVTITLNKTEGKNGWRLWSDGLRIYKNSGSSMTLTASENITAVEFTMAKASIIEAYAVNGADAVTVEDKVFTVSCDASTVNLDLTCTKNNGAIVSMKVITEDAAEPTPEADYTTGLENDKNTRSDRNTSVLTLSDDAGHTGSVTNLQTAGGTNNTMYFDRTESVAMTTVPGATITITATENMNWMHKYAYIDWGKDGFLYESPDTYFGAEGYTLLPGADLVAFNYFTRDDSQKSGYNHHGEYIGEDQSNLHTITFTIPEDAEPGIYRVRYKLDWNSLDPNGNQTLKTTGVKNIVGDGGIVADFTIEIAEKEVEPEPVERPEIQPNEELGEVMVHVASIDLVSGTPGGPKTWISGTTPSFIVTLDDNTSLNPLTDGTLALTCDNGIVTITPADPESYYISGYVYRATSGDGNDIEIAYPVDGELFGPDDFGYCYNEGMAEGSDVYFVATGSQLVISDIDVIFAPAATTEPEPARHTLAQGEGDLLANVVSLADGTLSSDKKLWTSNTTPQFTLTLTGGGRMEVVENDVFRIDGGNDPNTSVSISVASTDPAYYISGYVFDATGFAGDPAKITFGDKSIVTNDEIQYVWVDPIEEGTDVPFTVATTVSGHYKKPIVTNFDVRFTPVTSTEPEPGEIPDPSTWTALDRSNWNILGCSQRGGAGDTDGGFKEAIDGNTNTYWHSNWQQGAYEHSTPHFLVIDLGEGEHAYDGIGYLPRQNTNGGNGYCNDYAVYVTNDLTEISTAGTAANSYTTTGHSSMSDYMASHTPAAEGTMTYTTSNTDRPETRVHFTETKSERYVIFVFKTTANVETGKYHANCAELNLYAFRTEPKPVDHRPAGIAWLNNLGKLNVLYDAAAISAAQEAVNALADDATEEEVMAAAKTVYDNDTAIGKHIRLRSAKTEDIELENYYLAGNDDYMHFSYGEGAESDLTTVWAVAGTDTPGAYRLFNYGKQLLAGYNTASNQHQLWSEEGETFEFVVPTSIDGGCTLEETNQLVIIAHENNSDPTGYLHFGKNGDDESKWMITTWSSDSAGSHWRIALADDNMEDVTGTYDTATGIYTIACGYTESTFSHNATRHASHTIGLTNSANEEVEVELTDNGDGTFALDLSEQPQGQYVITIPMGYFATANGFSAAYTDTINHDYFSSITEINATAANAEWYNLQGIRVSAPAKGGIYLRATSTGVEKVIVR